jgi:hypothetical protein
MLVQKVVINKIFYQKEIKVNLNLMHLKKRPKVYKLNKIRLMIIRLLIE